MIDTLYLANYIETQLNANSLGKNFLVFADEGDMREAKRCCEYKYWTNCLLESISSTITPIKNMTFQTETLQVMFIVDLNEAGQTAVGTQDREQSSNLIDVKKCIYEMIERLNGTTQTETINGNTFAASFVFSSPTDGQKTQIGEASEALPIYLNVSVSFFQNGVNANDCHVYVNGEDLYFTRCVISKVNTADQNNFAGNANGAKAYMLSSGKSVDLILPTVSTTVGNLIMNDILENGKNNAIDVRIITPSGSKNFIGLFGNTSVSMDLGANLGYNISLVEANENLVAYDSSHWTMFTANQTDYASAMTIQFQIQSNIKSVVYWGDGTSSNLTAGSQATHVYGDRENHKIKYFKGTNGTGIATFNVVPIYMPSL